MKAPGTHKLITCIVPHGRGLDLVRRLHAEMGVDDAEVTTGRGHGADARGAFSRWDEIDMVSAVVASARADEVFAFLYEAGDLGHPHGGVVFQGPLGPATAFVLPSDIPEEDGGSNTRFPVHGERPG